MLEIINGGIETVVEDWPGRLGYLGKGMSASGALDNVALGLANLLVGNKPGEGGLEIAGGYFEAEFTVESVIAICGTDMKPTINGQQIPRTCSRVGQPAWIFRSRSGRVRCR